MNIMICSNLDYVINRGQVQKKEKESVYNSKMPCSVLEYTYLFDNKGWSFLLYEPVYGVHGNTLHCYLL